MRQYPRKDNKTTGSEGFEYGIIGCDADDSHAHRNDYDAVTPQLASQIFSRSKNGDLLSGSLGALGMELGVAPACQVVVRGSVADEDWPAVMLRRDTAVGFWEMRETETWVAEEAEALAVTVPDEVGTEEEAAWRA